MLGALVPSGAPLSSLAAANRAIALLIIWSTAYVLGRFRETWLSLQVRSKELADIDYALDQSAIVATTLRSLPSSVLSSSSSLQTRAQSAYIFCSK